MSHRNGVEIAGQQCVIEKQNKTISNDGLSEEKAN